MKPKRVLYPYVLNELSGEVTLFDEARKVILDLCKKGEFKTNIAHEIGVKWKPYGMMYVEDLIETGYLVKRVIHRYEKYFTTDKGLKWLKW